MASRVKINNIKELKKRKNSTHPTLVNIRKILLLLKNPEKNLGITIGITGTNGKGSVAKTLSSILNDSNLKILSAEDLNEAAKKIVEAVK